MKGTTMGMETSHSRVNVKPSTSTPSASKVQSNSAHGASMETRGKPDGWATFGGGGGGTANSMRSESYPAGSGSKSANMSPKGPKPRSL